MILSQTCLHRARVTVQLTSPMMIATGQSLNANDNNLVRDENGWPMIPGTSLAGVLRSLMLKTDCSAVKYFGLPENSDADKSETSGEDSSFELSGIQVSAGLVHNSHNQVQEANKAPTNDEILDLLAADVPIQRNGVAINNRGVAHEKSKHDRTLVPTGTRFTFEISWWAEQLQPQQWQNILSLLAHPMCALGSGTRIGQGTFKLISLHDIQLDLTDVKQAEIFRGLNKSLTIALTDNYTNRELSDLQEQADKLLPVSKTEMHLLPENGWRIGGGNQSLGVSEKTSGLFPYSEIVINWQASENPNGESATLAAQALVIPGSSIKGAFAHRLEFHFRRLQQLWADDKLSAYRETDIKHLLGWIDGQQGQVGHLWFADCYVLVPKENIKLRTRNKIDRLTGGTINQALFVEERVYSDAITLNMFLDKTAIEALVMSSEDEASISDGIDETLPDEEKVRLEKVEKSQLPKATVDDIKKAIDMALRDLKTGRLALGAGQNNGAGFFTEVSGNEGATK